jgi:DNA polymerase-3 subunit delta'
MRLSAVLGQPAAVRLLSRLIARDRLPHALLLDGRPGCGRRTLSTAIAQALLCPARDGGEACDTCTSCTLVREGNHPDLVALPHDTEPGEIGVDAVRSAIVEGAQQSALMGERRAFVLPGIERLNLAAANALLKVLEEPPAGTYLLMTTANVSGLLRTIRSRSQLIRLQPLSAADCEQVLMRGGITAAEARRRAATGAGSHRGLWEAQDEIPLDALLALCRDGFSSAAVQAVMDVLPTKANEELGRTLAQEQRRILGRWLMALAQALRTDLPGPRGMRAVEAIERIGQLQRDLHLNLNPRLVIEGLALGARAG